MTLRLALAGLALAAATALSGCVQTDGQASLSSSGMVPPMQWDKRPEATTWTTSTLAALETHDEELAASVPSDIDTWCPGYKTASLQDRRAFWSGLMSAVARYESSWNPKAAGAGGRYVGIMQISPKTASRHSCSADTAAELKNGAENLVCAASIVAAGVAQDGVVAGPGNRGAGRDWMPFRDAEKRAAMSAWTSAQPYCAG